MEIFNLGKKKKTLGFQPSKPREKKEVQQDYLKLAAELGSVEYQIQVLGQQKQQLAASMADLNIEGAEIEKIEAKKKGIENGKGNEIGKQD